MEYLRLGLLASHTGSNVQAVVRACKQGRLQASPEVIISNNREAAVLSYAVSEGVSCYHLSSKTHEQPEELDAAILHVLQKHDVDLVVLAGYMKKLGRQVLSYYQGRILNIHPSLLPQFGGRGMYGRHVHEAVLAAGVEKTGITVHLVDEVYDHGEILAQREVPVFPDDNVATLSERVLQQEHLFYVDVLQKISQGIIQLK